MEHYALLSVSDKTGIEDVARTLHEQGVQLLSTGGTYQALTAAGLPVTQVSDYTGYPELFDGRVKTLHPKIHGGILAVRDDSDHQKQLADNAIDAIDYVIVNLYPFKETIHKSDVTQSDAIENIDIGGPTLLRSAAKNARYVTVVTDPADYPTLIEQVQANGATTAAFRAYLAQKVFALTAHYDATIASYFAGLDADSERDFEPAAWPFITKTYDHKTPLRYGENSHQPAAFYQEVSPAAFSVAGFEQLNGKKLSYNNLKDADAALRTIREFQEPTAVAMKHMNPCGVGVADDIETAFDLAYKGDDISIYGGIVSVNRPVTLAVAEKMAKIFLEIIIAPDFEPDALARLQKKKNLRLLKVDFDKQADSYKEKEYVTVTGGILEQVQDQSDELAKTQINALPADWQVASKRQPTEKEIRAMNFAMKVVKHVKSNAIVITNENMVLGVGGGQPNRIDAAKIAIEKAEAKDPSLLETLVLASDAFLPMDDTATFANQHHISAIIQPGGSIHDDDSIQVVDETGMAMVMTGHRHFRH